MKNKLIIFLKTIPEISFCEILIPNNYIYLDTINNTSFSITPNIAYFTNNQSAEYFTNLVEAGIKQTIAHDISHFLLKLLTNDKNAKADAGFTYLRLKLEPLMYSYTKEGSQ